MPNLNNHSFQKGFDKIPNGEVKQARSELMEALKITSRPAWLRWIRGEVDPKVSQIEAVEAVFAKYGIKKTEIWG